MSVGARIPVLCYVKGTTDNPKSLPSDTFFKVKLMEPGAKYDFSFVEAKDMISHYGKEWTTTMLSFYCKQVAYQACNPKDSLHRFGKEQLLLIASFARHAKLRLEEVFGQAMAMKDDKARGKYKALGPKLKALLQLSEKINVPDRIPQDKPSRPWEDEPKKVKKMDLRCRDLASKKPAEIKENRSLTRRALGILEKDQSVMEKIKKGGLKGLSIRNTRLSDIPDPVDSLESSLGKRSSLPDEQEDDSWETDSAQQCYYRRNME